jgi:hypothetical protein
MGPLVGPVAALLPCLLAQAVTVTLGDRSEARMRIQAGEARSDVETRPSVTFGVGSRRWTSSVGYTLSITELSVGTPDSQLNVYHTGFASTGLRFQRTSFSLGASATYGTQNFRAQGVAPATSAAPTVPAQPLPQAPGMAPAPSVAPPPGAPAQINLVDSTVLFGSASASAGAQHILSRRATIGASGGYQISGGLDEPSRTSIPIQKGPLADARFGYAASHVDTLSTVGNARWIRTDDSTDARLYGLGEEWTHHFAQTWTGTVGGGVSYGETETLVAPITRTKALVPGASASTAYAIGMNPAAFEMSAGISLAPTIDRLSGRVDQRIGWGAGIGGTRRKVTLTARVSGAYSVDRGPNALTAYGAAAGARYRFARGWALEGGASAGWQRMGAFEALPILWGLYLALTFGSPPIPL